MALGMPILSAILFFLSHHFILAMPLIILACGTLGVLLAVWRKQGAWLALLVFGFLLGMANVFTGHIANALFLNAVGVNGTAVITHETETNSMLNDHNIWQYDAVLKTADNRDIVTTFDDMSASIYPIRNAILIPPQAQPFAVKYVPGYPRNFVILSDQSTYGKQRLIQQDLQPVEKAAAQLAVSPNNPAFIAEYRSALKTFIATHRNDADPAIINDCEQKLAALSSTAP